MLILCEGKNCPMSPYQDLSGALDVNGLCCACCPFGQRNTLQCKALDPNHIHFSVQLKRLMMEFRKHCIEEHGAPPLVQTHEGNGSPKGAFAFTLTASPADGLTEADMVAAVRKVMSQKSCPVKKYAWYLEYGNPELKEHPHIHGMYETEKQGVIEKKHWQRAWKIWDPSQRLGAGFRGGYHRPVRSDEAYSQYIAKQNILGESNGC